MKNTVQNSIILFNLSKECIPLMQLPPLFFTKIFTSPFTFALFHISLIHFRWQYILKNKLKSTVNNVILFIKEVLYFVCGIFCYLVSWKSKRYSELLSKQLHSLNSSTQVHTIPK